MSAPTIRPAWPLRAFVAWPLATAAVGAFEIARQLEHTHTSAVSIAVALWCSAAMGVWLGLLFGLTTVLLAGRGWLRRLDRDIAGHPVVATAAFATVVITLVAWIGIDTVSTVSEHYPVDYAQTQTRLWRGVTLLAAPVAACAAYLGLRACERRLDSARGARWITRLSALAVLWRALAHFSSGPFFVYFGGWLALGLVGGGALTAVIWLPRNAPSKRALAWLGVAMAATAVGAPVGLQHLGARTLLLHETRIAPHIVKLGLGWADRDSDGDFPTWLGGSDCDDGNPDVAGWRTEIAGNGIDDNCFGGDLPLETPAPPQINAGGPRPTVILITIDTVRADHLETYGAARETMPALHAWASKGLVFDRAYAPANHTFFSMTALLSGQSTERLLVAADRGVPQLAYKAWLPDRLQRLGYRTVAINPPLVVDGKLSAAQLRFAEIEVGHFDYAGKNRGTTARQVADASIQRIRAHGDGDGPLAMWIHFMDPHAVHESPIRFSGSSLADAYDNELSWVDQQLGRILRAVHERFGEDTIVVVTSDHGEALGELGNYGHGFSLREHEVRVPLVLVSPDIEAGRHTEPVSTLALLPTLLELLGQPAHPRMSHGSLLHPPTAPVIVTNPAFLWDELRMEAALVESRYKLVLSRTTHTMQLFDLHSDPDERFNLAPDTPQTVERMRDILLTWLERERRFRGAVGPPPSPTPAPISPARAPASAAPPEADADADADDHASYTCSMHPSVQLAAPGQCPICGMDLLPSVAGSGGATDPLPSPWRACLKAEDCDVREQDIRAFIQAARTSPQSQHRTAAVAGLPATIQLQQLADPESDVRTAAAYALAKRGDLRVLPELAAASADDRNDPQGVARMAAIDARLILGDKAAAPDLEPWLTMDATGQGAVALWLAMGTAGEHNLFAERLRALQREGASPYLREHAALSRAMAGVPAQVRAFADRWDQTTYAMHARVEPARAQREFSRLAKKGKAGPSEPGRPLARSMWIEDRAVLAQQWADISPDGGALVRELLATAARDATYVAGPLLASMARHPRAGDRTRVSWWLANEDAYLRIVAAVAWLAAGPS